MRSRRGSDLPCDKAIHAAYTIPVLAHTRGLFEPCGRSVLRDDLPDLVEVLRVVHDRLRERSARGVHKHHLTALEHMERVLKVKRTPSEEIDFMELKTEWLAASQHAATSAE